MQNGHNPDPAPFWEAHHNPPLPKGRFRGVWRSETQRVHNAANNPVIPAKAGIQKGQNAGPDDHPDLDVEAARKSMARMANIFADIAKHAEESTLGRCPYKDAKSRCTAKFACTNQHFTKNPLNPPICTARDGDLNYRSAWQI